MEAKAIEIKQPEPSNGQKLYMPVQQLKEEIVVEPDVLQRPIAKIGDHLHHEKLGIYSQVKRDVVNHENVHIKDHSIPQYYCGLSNQYCNTISALTLHKPHDGLSNMFNTQKLPCKKDFAPKHLLSHLTEPRPLSEPSLYCLEQYNMSPESSTEKKTFCDACKKQFKNTSRFQKHKCSNKQYIEQSLMRQLNTEQKPFSCNTCNKLYWTMDKLNMHKCSEDKQFSCEICNKMFTEKYSLMRHMSLHGEKPFPCDICHKQFTDNYRLKMHRLYHEEKQFSCDICTKQFTRRCDLMRHMRIHLREKPFSCELCSKQFTRRCDLMRHMRIHLGEKMFSCNICNKQFRDKCDLRRHHQRHHTEKSISSDMSQ